MPQTNIVQVETADSAHSRSGCGLGAEGLLTRPWGRTRLRCVTHRHIEDEDIDSAVQAFAAVLEER